ncbi:hypothetical protein EDC04DRAFT_2610295 [Pisolithus marmoratus]|nr:hypothetical protein EDC04DRAFT_2610295 [Pisolithus marmoratus]
MVNPLTWLVTTLSQQDLPITFRDSIFIPSPFTTNTSFPEGTLKVIKLKFDGTAPLYLGTHKDGDLRMSTNALASMVTATFNLPHDPYVPTLPHRRNCSICPLTISLCGLVSGGPQALVWATLLVRAQGESGESCRKVLGLSQGVLSQKETEGRTRR